MNGNYLFSTPPFLYSFLSQMRVYLQTLFGWSRSIDALSNLDQVSASWIGEFWSLPIIPKLAGDGGGALNPLKPAQYDWKPIDLVITGEYGEGSGESGQSAGSGGQKSPLRESLMRLTVWTPALVMVKLIGGLKVD
jgi:hypothetical protein